MGKVQWARSRKLIETSNMWDWGSHSSSQWCSVALAFAAQQTIQWEALFFPIKYFTNGKDRQPQCPLQCSGASGPSEQNAPSNQNMAGLLKIWREEHRENKWSFWRDVFQQVDAQSVVCGWESIHTWIRMTVKGNLRGQAGGHCFKMSGALC